MSPFPDSVPQRCRAAPSATKEPPPLQGLEIPRPPNGGPSNCALSPVGLSNRSVVPQVVESRMQDPAFLWHQRATRCRPASARRVILVVQLREAADGEAKRTDLAREVASATSPLRTKVLPLRKIATNATDEGLTGIPLPRTTAESRFTMFERERATYEANKAELLKFEGQFVVIRGDQILGHYGTTAEAFDAGLRAYGPEPFFLHHIVRDEPSVFNPFAGYISGRPPFYPV